MTDSPVPFRSRTPRRRLGGYDRADVDRLLEDLGRNYAEVCAERDELTARLEKAQEELSRYVELEHVLRDSIVTGQQAADELRERASCDAEAALEAARQRAEALIRETHETQDEARVEARRVAEELVTDARAERASLQAEIEELETVKKELHASARAFLRAALDVIENGEWSLDPGAVENLRSSDSHS